MTTTDKRMRILITGGAGMVGSHAAEYFARQGHEVVVFDALIRSQLSGAHQPSVEYNWQRLQQMARVHCLQGDVRCWEDVQSVFRQPIDAVIHAAAQPGIGFSLQQPLDDFTINAQGTLHVLECVRQYAPHAAVIFCSTNKVYGTNVDRLPLRELATRYAFAESVTGVDETLSVDLTGHTPYGASKLAGDLYVQDYAQTYGLRTAVFRMSCIYGEHQFGFEDQGWVAHFVISLLLHRPITIYGDGKQVRDVLYVGDLVQAFNTWLTSALPHAVYNIGGGPQNTLSLHELLTFLKEQTGRTTQVIFRPWRPNDQKVYVSDLRKITQTMGWQPRVTVSDGLHRLLGWVTAHRELF